MMMLQTGGGVKFFSKFFLAVLIDTEFLSRVYRSIRDRPDDGNDLLPSDYAPQRPHRAMPSRACRATGGTRGPSRLVWAAHAIPMQDATRCGVGARGPSSPLGPDERT